MSRYNTENKIRTQFEGCYLSYKLDRSDERSYFLHQDNYKVMKDALEAVGVYLDVSDDELRLSINPEQYANIKCRYAGRTKKYVWKSDNFEDGFYKYSDLVLMLQTMNDKDIYEKLGISSATFYRRKRTMINSTFYQALDPNRMNDKKYLENMPGNYAF